LRQDLPTLYFLEFEMYEANPKDTRPVVCFYHSNCLDGVAAAHVVNTYFRTLDQPREVKCIPSSYNSLPEDLDQYKDHLIFVVDFSFKREVVLQMMENNEVIILDHHDTAAKELKGLVEVDQSHSGVILTWRFFYGTSVVPPTAYLYIEDRDLWNFRMLYTKEWCAAAFSYPIDLEHFETIFSTHPNEMIRSGQRFLMKQKKDVDNLILNTRRMQLDGLDIPVVNAGYQFASDVGALLSPGEFLAAIYEDRADGRHFSLRSCKGDELAINVGELAVKFGGGGHVNAAGFSIKYDDHRFPASHIVLSPLPENEAV